MHVGPTEVEHWRPKGELEGDAGKKIKPGYYWLAAAWDNLLPSCIDCNRGRYQKVGLSNGEKVLLGKQNSFPLANGSRRAKKPGEEANEIPLLLHPCKDRPEDFLEFAEDEKSRGIMREKLDAAGQPLPRSKASIKTFGLHRNALVLARRKRFIEIEEQIVRVQEAVERINNDRLSEADRRKEDATLRRELNTLKSFKEAKQRFSLMAKQIVDKFVATVTLT